MISVAGRLVFFVKNLIRNRTGISTLLAQSKKKRVDQTTDTPFFRAAAKLAPVSNMDKNDLGAYYFELNRILWAVIKEKINLLPTELSKGNIFLDLSKQGWTPEEVWQLELSMTE